MRITKRSLGIVDFLEANLTSGRALVAMHDNPDPDCIAAGMCLKIIFERKYNVETTLAYAGMLGRAENRTMVKECDIELTHARNIKQGDYDFIATVDSQPQAGNNFLSSSENVKMVIDHHPRIATTRQIPWVDIRTQYGATSTIALEYMMAHKIEPSRIEATALLYALRSETQDLGREASPADRRAYFHLFPNNDFQKMYNIVNAEVSREYFRSMFNALENAKIHNDVLITDLEDIQVPDYVAEIADRLLRLKDIRWILVIGQKDKSIFLSIRTSNRDVSAGDVMKQLVAELGSGGGHEMIAGGRIDTENTNFNYRELVDELSSRFRRALRKRSPASDLLNQ